MRPLKYAIYICLILLTISCGRKASLVVTETKATDNDVLPSALRTDLLEYTNEYYGSDSQRAQIVSKHPRFSWIVPSIGDGTKQTAYRITIDQILNIDECWYEPVWDSGWVESSQSVAVPYLGPALEPDAEYEWSVQLMLSNAAGRQFTTREERYKGVYNSFKMAKDLCEYATPEYPLIDERQLATADINGVYDFGKVAFGKMELILYASRNTSVKVIIGERLKDGKIEQTPRVSSVVYDEIDLNVKEGISTYLVEPTRNERNTGPMAVPTQDYVGVVAPFRYCSIEGDVEAVTVARISYSYPFDEDAASFRCSNDTLNAIWDLCHYSLKPCSFLGIWVDGNRERIPYEYDALIAQLCHYGADAEYSIDRRTLEWLLEKPTWPTEWILYAVEMAWNDYMWTGDDRALKANYEVLKAHGLDALRQDNGLITTKKGQSEEFLASIRRGTITDIVDWPHNGIEDDGFVYTDFNAVVNALYYRTLLRLADIAAVTGHDKDTGYFTAEAAKTRDAFHYYFFDPETGIYCDGIDTDHSSLHTNMMALLCDLVEEEDVPAVADFVESRGLNCSIFGAHNLLAALYAAGRGDAALKLMTGDGLRSWYNGLRLGTTITLEAWDDSFKPNQDWNHIAGAAPGNAIPFGLMGITPAEPGFARAVIKPQTGNLEWAEITLPTIRGTIKMKIKDGVMTVTIPANMTADIWLPNPDGTHEYVETVECGRYEYVL